MFDGLFIVSLVGAAVQAIKESCEPTITKDMWGNKELYHKDIIDGISVEERMKNLKNGKYKQVNSYPEPHRDSDGKIIIENCKLFEEDKKQYGVVQAYKWVEQGKYNLTQEELRKENERIEKELEYLFSL